ncbi:MAG: BREX-1 system phosphatase PglZ type B [Polyangiaceae bacterium]|nr:BREX-1 system phosphatase PglZ type B [Polyangiaceae bacterium]
MARGSNGTVLEALAHSLAKASVYNRGVMVGPAAILWTDEGRQWEGLIPLLRDLLPSLVQLGPYDPAARSGPAIWLRCLLAGELEAQGRSGEPVPILYLPGVSRQMLRAVESCPRHLQPLAELQYRGVLWSQQNARDWSVLAFLKSKEGVGLDVAQDKVTLDAVQRALLMLADTPVETLRGRRLEGSDFDQLLSPDPARDLLRWMSDPDTTRTGWTDAHWEAFRSICQTTFGFDPQTDGALTAAEHIAGHESAWKRVWLRFVESPRSFPGIAKLLEQAHPAHRIVFDDERAFWPRMCTQAEDQLRSLLLDLPALTTTGAAKEIARLETEHGPRRGWVWAELGMAPLAGAMKHLSTLATICGTALGGASPDEMANLYRQGAWRADHAALQALASVERAEDLACVKAALQTIYQPWLGDAAERLQKLAAQHGYPGTRPEALAPVTATQGEVLFFADGLRYDIGERLHGYLERHGLQVDRDVRWTAMPSVTATCKPAVSPVTESITGLAFNENFQPSDAAEQKPLSIDRFRKLLDAAGYQVLRGEEVGEPGGRAWTEHGELDHMGHEQGWKLARRIDEQVREMAERIEALLAAGWKSVKVVTDHGWLLLPGGLPKVELPKFLADTRWGRCAVLKASAKSDGHLVVDWRWSNSVRIALAPGIGAFKAGIEYTHGGLSLQECLTPILVVKRGDVEEVAAIEEVTWRGLRCRVTVVGTTTDMQVDIRTKPAEASSSVANAAKSIDDEGRASLVVPDDHLIGTAAYAVVVNPSGAVVAKVPTCIGGGD